MENDRNAPATKGDLADLRAEIKSDMGGLEARIKSDMGELEARITETMRDIQTELLKAFYGFTESVQSRFKAQDDTEAGLKHRLTVLETRILEVERRLNTPPAP
jgi:hypothetical protein